VTHSLALCLSMSGWLSPTGCTECLELSGSILAVMLLLTASQSISQSESHLDLGSYLGLVVIFMLYKRKFWFCISWGALHNGWNCLFRKGLQSFSVS